MRETWTDRGRERKSFPWRKDWENRGFPRGPCLADLFVETKKFGGEIPSLAARTFVLNLLYNLTYMAYLAVAYPKLSESDFNWIQGYRKENDPRYFNIVNPHFTLVFAIGDIEKEVFLEEIRKQVAKIKKFNFELKVATINLDDSKEYHHEFLVPDKGYSNIVKLHDSLYSGLLSKYLRLDLDFIPHIGIGNSDDGLISKKRIDELNARGVDISGVVDTIDIIEYKDGTVTTLETVQLG